MGKKSWDAFNLYFTEAQDIIICTRPVICNPCDQNLVTDYVFDYGRKLDKKDDFRFSSWFKKQELMSTLKN